MTSLTPLDVVADMRLQIDEEDVRIYGEGERITVALPSLKTGTLLLNSGPFKTNRRNQLRLVNRWLQRAGLTVDVHLAGRQWARLGANARPGALARLLRLGNLNIRPGPSLRAAVKHRSGLVGLVLGLGSLGALLLMLRRKA